MNNTRIELSDDQLSKQYPLFYLVSSDKDLLNRLNKLLEKDGILAIYDIAGRNKYILDGRDNLFKVKYRVEQILEKFYGEGFINDKKDNVVIPDKINRNNSMIFFENKYPNDKYQYIKQDYYNKISIYDNKEIYQVSKIIQKTDDNMNSTPLLNGDDLNEEKLNKYMSELKKKAIIESLDKYNINSNLSAYKYIADILDMCNCDPMKLRPLSKNVYPVLAKKYNKDCRVIERVILYGVSKSGFRLGNIDCLSMLYCYARLKFSEYTKILNEMDREVLVKVINNGQDLLDYCSNIKNDTYNKTELNNQTRNIAMYPAA